MYIPKFAVLDPLDTIQSYNNKGQFYEYFELQYMSKWIPPGATVLDVGANVGNHTVYYSKFTQAKTIYVIEPIKRTVELLLQNLKLNECNNVVTEHLGVGLGNQNVIAYPFLDHDHNLGGARLAPQIVNHPSIKQEWLLEPVQVVIGDEIFENIKIDFMKMDIEGMEMVAIQGLQKTLAKSRPAIYIEVQRENMEMFKQWTKFFNYKIELVDSINYGQDTFANIDRICQKDFYINFMILPN